MVASDADAFVVGGSRKQFTNQYKSLNVRLGYE